MIHEKIQVYKNKNKNECPLIHLLFYVNETTEKEQKFFIQGQSWNVRIKKLLKNVK